MVTVRRLRPAAWFAACCVAIALPTAPRACQAQAPTPASEIRYFNREWSFEDVDVSTLTTWLGRIGVEVPVALNGRITGTLAIGVPWGALREAQAWRFAGRVTSPRFTADEFTFDNVAVRLSYRDGALVLDELQLDVPAAAGEPSGTGGHIGGNAHMGVVPRGQFTATLDVRDLSLAGPLAKLPSVPPASGRFTGRLTAAVDVDNITRVEAWRAEGPLAVQDFVLRDSPPADASVQIILEQGTVVARNLRLQLAQNSIEGTAFFALRPPYAWGARANVSFADVPAALAIVHQLAPSAALAAARQVVSRGALATEIDARGTATPLTGGATGTATLQGFTLTPPATATARIPLRPLDVQRLAFRYEASTTALRLTEIDARLAGGEVTGSLHAPFTGGRIAVELAWTNLRVGDVVAGQGVEAGVSSGSIVAGVPSERAADLAAWQADVNASLSHVAAGGVALTEFRTGALRIDRGELRAPDIRFRMYGDPCAIAIDLGLDAPYAFVASFRLPNLDLAMLARAPQLTGLADRLSGWAGVAGTFRGTLAPLVVQGSGALGASAIAFDGRRIDRIDVDFTLEGDAIALSNLHLVAYGGTLEGSATIPVREGAVGGASLAWSAIDLGAALAGMPLGPATLGGATAGSLTLQIPAGAIAEPRRWTGAASLALGALRIYDFDFEQVAAPDVRLHDGRLDSPNIAAVLDGRPVQAALALPLEAPRTLDVRVQATRFQARRLSGLPSLDVLAGRLAGFADTNTHLQISLETMAVDVEGWLAVDGIVYESLRFEGLSANYRLAPASLAVTNLAASLYGGTIAGQAVVPLADDVPTSAEVRWNAIDVGQLVTDLLRPPKPLAGTTTGSATLAIPAGQLGDLAAWTFTAHVELPDLRVRSRPIAAIIADASQRDGELTYSGSGTLLGGQFSLEGVRNAALPARGPRALGSARVTLRGANFGALGDLASGAATAPAPLAGTFDLELASQATAEAWAWQAAAATGAVTAGERLITPGVQVRAAGDERRAAIQQLSGRVAGGELAGAGEWDFDSDQRRGFRIRLRQASIELLQALAQPGRDAAAEGVVDIDVRVRPAAVWQMQIAVTAARATVGGLALRNVTVPLAVQWSPRSGQAVLTTTSTQLSLAGGRLSGALTARRVSTWNVDGHFRFYRVDAAALAGSSGYASGRLSGTLDIAARNARSVNDLQATLLADLEGAQSAGIPVLDQIRTSVPGAGLAGATSFGEGRVEARLSRGVVRLDRLSLANRQLQIYMTGNITLGGRLGLNATVATGQAANPTIANSLLTNILAVPVAPAALLLQANEFLANRVIRLSIRGTLDRPTIRVRPLETLGEEAVRFFLRQSTGGVLGSGGVSLPQ
ncbi:MAG TPA: AsmA-like C-terminal region-containing protein [Lacipirellulaceae bacterium]|nr:AsmA-like C-terminal region-containing protein [Lacipirellulaceae bacterium]